MAKPFLTYGQQIRLLRDKQLVVEDDAAAEAALHQHGYFSLVSGYKDLLKNPTTGNYRDGTTFGDLMAVYQFDEQLRELTLRHLLHIEQHIRSVLSYAFCDNFGDAQTAYMLPQNYDISTPDKNKNVNKLIRKFIKPLVSQPTPYPYIEHHKAKHQNVPLWALVNALTFGTISKIYQYSKPQVQSAVSKEFEVINEVQLLQMLKVLANFRNVCAHNERLFTHRCAKHDIPDLPLHQKLAIPRNGQEYVYGKRDYFAVVLTFRYLLPHSEFLIYKKHLSNLIDALCANTQQIMPSAVLDMMGLPHNWKKVTAYRKS